MITPGPVSVIIDNLMKSHRRSDDIMHAVDVMRDQFRSYFPGAREDDAEKEESNELCAGLCVSEVFPNEDLNTPQELGELTTEDDDDDSNTPQEMGELTTEDEMDPLSSPLLAWYLQTDPSVGLESLEGEWLERKELWQVETAWTRADVHDFLALLTIDSAVLHIEQHEPFKAAVAAARASEHHGMATAIRRSGSVQKATASTFGQKGADARHGHNRAVRKKAIQIYLSKGWPSVAQAARSISKDLNRSERVVEKWLREHRRGLSAGTVPT